MRYPVVMELGDRLQDFLGDVEKSRFIAYLVHRKIKQIKTIDILHCDVGDPFRFSG